MNANLETQENIVTGLSQRFQTAFAVVGETGEHVVAREALLDRAMGEGRRRKSSEKLRRGRQPAEGLAFAATGADGSLAGTVRLWNVHAGLDGFGFPVSALLLGPLAVDPSTAGCGIGSALMQHAIAEAKRLGHGAILLVGDPEYYERFGFSAEKTGELAMPGPFEKRRFLAIELKSGHLDGAQGILRASGRKLPRVETTTRQTA
ncbi:acetyltransferase family protein [Ochrobactrum quorumnocens]|uniref:Acetyltransferase family protein n=1 Tax=Ochrobactrum quorumnocens TaxID=271865 RepID=A0A248UEC1_9HYPH|nr:N-acetyltransferase [[Ochrobactrum] quorumnocens]ASV84751.1 acetyltransferase family protein [[Ochrobactrum] quorumnocens]